MDKNDTSKLITKAAERLRHYIADRYESLFGKVFRETNVSKYQQHDMKMAYYAGAVDMYGLFISQIEGNHSEFSLRFVLGLIQATVGEEVKDWMNDLSETLNQSLENYGLDSAGNRKKFTQADIDTIERMLREAGIDPTIKH